MASTKALWCQVKPRFYFPALPSLVYGFQSQDVVMVQNGCWSSRYYTSVPGKKQEEGEEKVGSTLAVCLLLKEFFQKSHLQVPTYIFWPLIVKRGLGIPSFAWITISY